MKTTCIVPAYNEGSRIKNVLLVVANHPLIDEVIVVDDGSIDATASIVAEFNSVRLIRKETNVGKSKAIATGIRHAQGSTLLFMDADLEGLTTEAVSRLLEPLENGAADVAISLRGNALFLYRILGIDFVSGERALARDLVLTHVEAIENLPRFGVEVYLNDLFLMEKSRITIVPWKEVKSTLKVKKFGLAKGLLREFEMLEDIFQTISIVHSSRQIFFMLRARVPSRQ